MMTKKRKKLQTFKMSIFQMKRKVRILIKPKKIETLQLKGQKGSN